MLTSEQAEELLKGGTERARQHCAEELAKGNYWPGCPIQSKSCSGPTVKVGPYVCRPQRSAPTWRYCQPLRQ